MALDPQDRPPQKRTKRAAVQLAAFSEKKWVAVTQKFILVMVGVIIVFDLFLALNDERGDTISEVMKEWAYRRFFVVTWAWGVLAGHLFLTHPAPVIAPPWNIWLLLGLTVVLLGVGFGYRGIVGVQVQLVLLVAGVIAGRLLWPQAPVGM